MDTERYGHVCTIPVTYTNTSEAKECKKKRGCSWSVIANGKRTE